MKKKFKPGVSFSDFVISDSQSRPSRIREEKTADYRRGWLVWIGLLVAFGILVVRLLFLQVFYGSRYRILADENRIKKVKLTAPRGTIYDRNGLRLAETNPSGQRIYPVGAAAVHVIGFLGEVKPDEVGLLKTAGGKYDAGDLMGRSGIEAQYEESLRGQEGGRLVEVDAVGKIIRELGRREPVPGRDIHLSISENLQQTAMAALNAKKGAVVVSNPINGEILALVSSPGFDPNNISAEYGDLRVNPDLPFLDRSIGAVYPPGSTFKIVTTTAAITDGKVAPDFTFRDEGIIRVGSFSYTNWLYNRGGGTEGVIGFTRAITRSTDTFFYKVGEMTTPEVMADWATKMGLGKKTGIDIPGEVDGLIPTPDWKEKVIGDQWYLGDTYHMAIGQGDVLATPIQINLVTNLIADAGSECKLHLVKDAIVPCTKIDIDLKALEIIKEGLIGACSPGGTAFPLFGFLPQVACKTGTAEYIAENGKTKTHGWLTAYAPADNPTISVTVVMEGGGEGSNVAAPVVRKILAKYFNVPDNYNYAAIPQGAGE